MANVLVALASRSNKVSGSLMVPLCGGDAGDDGAVGDDFSLSGRGSG